MKFRIKIKSSAYNLFIYFIFMAVIGSFLLSLPFCYNGEKIPFIDAIFVTVSAICVTGLSTVDMSVFSNSVCLSNGCSRFLQQARLAQSVERQALNLVVGGSSPPVGDSFITHFQTFFFHSLLFLLYFHYFTLVYLLLYCNIINMLDSFFVSYLLFSLFNWYISMINQYILYVSLFILFSFWIFTTNNPTKRTTKQ